MKCLFKKFSILILAFAMIFTGIPSFADVDSNNMSGKQPVDIDSHWAKGMITKLLENDIVTGYNDGTFKPNKNVTREEACIMLGRYLKIDINAKYHNKFIDMNGRWSAPYVCALSDKGIVKGYVDNTFRPDKPITREEFSVIIYRYLSEIKDMKDVPVADFPDAVSSWAKEAVGKLASLKVINGYSNGLFKGGNYILRGEVAKLITGVDGIQDKPVLVGDKKENNDKKDKDKEKENNNSSITPGFSGGGGSSSGGGGTSGSGSGNTTQNPQSDNIKSILEAELKYATEILKRPIDEFRNILDKADYDNYVSGKDKAKNCIDDSDFKVNEAINLIDALQSIRIKYNHNVSEVEMQVIGACDVEIKKGTPFNLKKGIYVEGQYENEYDITIVAEPAEIDTNIVKTYSISYTLTETDNKIPEKTFTRKVNVVDTEAKDLIEYEKSVYLAEDAFLDVNVKKDENLANLAKVLASVKNIDLSVSSKEQIEAEILKLKKATEKLTKNTQIDKSNLINAINEGEKAYNDPKKDGLGKRELKDAIEQGKRINEKSSSTKVIVDKITEKINTLIGQLQDDNVPPFLRVKNISKGDQIIKLTTEKSATVRVVVSNDQNTQKEIKEQVAETVDVEINLDNALEYGDSVKVTSTDKAGNVQTSTYKIYKPLKKPELLGEELKAGDSIFKVKAEENVNIEVSSDKDSSLRAKNVDVSSDGITYTVTLSRDLKGKELIKVKAVGTGVNENRPDSEELIITAAAVQEKTKTPTFKNQDDVKVDAEEVVIIAEKGSEIKIKDNMGINLLMFKVEGSDEVSPGMVEYTLNLNSKLEENQEIIITAQAEGKKISDELRYIVPQESSALVKPEIINPEQLKAGVDNFKVRADEDVTIRCSCSDSSITFSTFDDTPGVYIIRANKALSGGERIEIYAVKFGFENSETLIFDVPAAGGVEPPTTLSIINIEGANAGSKEISFVTIKDADTVRVQIKRGYSTIRFNMTDKGNGKYVAHFRDDSEQVMAGDLIIIHVEDKSYNETEEKIQIPLQGKADKPQLVGITADEVLEQMKELTVSAEENSGFEISTDNSTGIALESAAAKPDNAREYLLKFTRKLIKGEKITIISKVAGKEASDGLVITVGENASTTKTFSAVLDEEKVYTKYQGFKINLDIDNVPDENDISIYEVVGNKENKINKLGNYSIEEKSIEFTRNAIKDKDGKHTIRIKIDGYESVDVVVTYVMAPTTKPVLLNGDEIEGPQGIGAKIIKIKTMPNAVITVKKVDDEYGEEEDMAGKFEVTNESEEIYVLKFKKAFGIADKFKIYAKTPDREISYALEVVVGD